MVIKLPAFKNIGIKFENDVRGSYVHLRGRTVMWNEVRNHLFVLIFLF